MAPDGSPATGPVDCRAVLITGGSGDIGAAVARSLLTRPGRTVVVIDRVPPLVAGVQYVPADLSVAGAARDAVERAASLGPFDAIVNCIGYYGCHTLATFNWDDFERSFQINARAPVEAILSWLPHRPPSRATVAVNVTSAAARTGSRDLAYSTAKAALEGATRSLARSLASEHVTVVAVAPGLVDTQMSAAMPPERSQEHARASFLRRPAQPREVAELIVFLLDGASAFMTGSVVNLSGGLL